MLRAVLRHFFRQLEVHVIPDTLGCVFLHLVNRTNDLGLDRPLGWEGFHDGLSLKLDGRFRQDG